MTTVLRVALITLVATVSVALLRCSPVEPDDHAGSSTQVGNPGSVAGILYEPDGTTPASGVRVVIRPRPTLADTGGVGVLSQFADTASVITDDSGRYAFDTTLDTGTYVIEATDGNHAVLIDSVVVQNPDSTLELPPDTLKPAGALKGVIRLSEGGDPRKVFVLAFGVDRFARVEADGRFRFASLAEARYDLRFVSSLDNYGVLDTCGVSVRAGDTTDLDTVELPYTGIPGVKALSLTQDSVNRIVTLHWGKANTTLVAGYHVYRTAAGSATVKLTAAPVADTVYSDSTAAPYQQYSYQVRAVDGNGNEGPLGVAMEVQTAGAVRGVTGLFYFGDGLPATGVRVEIRPERVLGSSAATVSGLPSVVTDKAGRFVFDTALDTGLYVIEAIEGNMGVLVDSVAVPGPQTAVQLAPDTLRALGAIKGRIVLTEGGDPRSVTVLAFGLDRFAQVGADGRFVFGGLAQAVYDLRIVSTLDDYEVLDTFSVTVRAGDTTDLDTIELPFTGIPTPTGLTISYDTLKQIVTLAWDKSDTALIGGYNVYRRSVDSGVVTARVNSSPVTVTLFRDSTGTQEQTYEYRVRAYDKQGNEGESSSGVSVKLVGAFVIVDSIVKGSASIDGNFGHMARGVCDAKGNFYIIDNSSRWLQKLDSVGNFRFKVDTFQVPISVTNHVDSFLYVCDYNVRKIWRTDLSGNVMRAFPSIGRPSGVCSHGDTLFVSSDSGIGAYSLDGELLTFIHFQFHGWFSQPQLIAASSGLIYVVEDRGLYEVDVRLCNVRSVWSFDDQEEDQQAQVSSYSGDTVVIVAPGSKSHLGRLYLVDRTGKLAGKWYCGSRLSGVTLSIVRGLVCFSPGRILFLKRR